MHITDKRDKFFKLRLDQVHELLDVCEILYGALSESTDHTLYKRLDVLFKELYPDENDLFWVDYANNKMKVILSSNQKKRTDLN